MITLEQVSTARLVRYLKHDTFHSENVLPKIFMEKKKCYEALIKYNITNYAQLESYIRSGIPEFQSKYLINSLINIKMALLNAQGYSAVLYPTKGYEGTFVDSETLRKTDLSNNGGILLFGNPLERNTVQVDALNGYSIYELKHMLNGVVVDRCTTIGENALANNIPQVGNTSVAQVRDAINFYEQQVLRQANEYKWCRNGDITGENIFTLDKDIKMQLLKEQINDILIYLVNNAGESVWGKFTEKQKLMLLDVISGSKEREALIAREYMINAISNYTTLGEIEEGLVRTRVINRFIR